VSWESPVPRQTTTHDAERRRELGLFLRTRRNGLQPEDVGLVSHGPRRVKGLRRDEVADLASVSVSWYACLEQGRDVGMSTQVLDAIAGALRLDHDEWLHFRRLAGAPVLGTSASPEDIDIGPGANALLDDLLPNLAYFFTGPWDVVACNRAAELINWDLDEAPLGHPNVLARVFLGDPKMRTDDWEAGAYQIVALLRNESGKHPDNPRYEQVINRLLETSDEFRRMWGHYEVRSSLSPTWSIRLPDVGVIRTRVFYFTWQANPLLTLSVAQPADEESRERITRLLAAHAGPEGGSSDAPRQAR
jgi:transcriptional regulator with XRE-family HTH domain